jgi:hypothetical protein
LCQVARDVMQTHHAAEAFAPRRSLASTRSGVAIARLAVSPRVAFRELVDPIDVGG